MQGAAAVAAPASAAAEPAGATAAAGQPADLVEYVGMVKSYNERRGFGFVSCAGSAEAYGRDVYVPKVEVQLMLQHGSRLQEQEHQQQWWAGQPSATTRGGKPFAKAAQPPQAPALEEEDFLAFGVRLSADGFPQAERLRRLRCYRAIVTQVPGGPHEATGRAISEDLQYAEVLLSSEACGQARLAVGDQVYFCLKEDSIPGCLPEARVALVSARPPQNTGLVLGCFSLSLPRPPAYEGGHARPDLQLDGHALEDRILLSGLPTDVSEAELMRFFGKHGALRATMAPARAGLFAAVAFERMADVAKLVGGSSHTFADDKETRTARLRPQPRATASWAHRSPSLPGLPAPSLEGGREGGTMVVRWSPVILASGYVVELRPAGVQASWSTVDVATGELRGEAPTRGMCQQVLFPRTSSYCYVARLPPNVVFEARIAYEATCGCCSDPSPASAWCIACPSAVPLANPEVVLSAAMCPPCAPAFQAPSAPPGSWARAVPQLAAAAPGAGGMPGWPVADPRGAVAWSPEYAHLAACAMPLAPPLVEYAGLQQVAAATLSWRCLHGGVSPPPSLPELRYADECGTSICLTWPAMSHAVAYVVELRDAHQNVERFVRSVPTAAFGGALMELVIGGLRAGPYSAQVRCLSACGCESDPSPIGYVQAALPLPAPFALPGGCLVAPRYAAPVAPPSGVPAWAEARCSGAPPAPLLPPAAAAPGAEQPALPSLLGATLGGRGAVGGDPQHKELPALLGAASFRGELELEKPVAMLPPAPAVPPRDMCFEATGHEDDCIILD